MSQPTANTAPPIGQEVKRETFHLVRLVLGALLVLVGLRVFVMESWPVQGPSMVPTLHDSERILVLKFPVLLSHLPFFGWMKPVEPGDLVVFETREAVKKRLVKRVLAAGPAASRVVEASVGGHHGVQVKYDHGTVYVNNRRVEEPYLDPSERRTADEHVATLGSGEYYVLGDNRSISRDSRILGPVKEEQIIGRAVLRFWPLSKFALL
jgi:signal peptidase I